MKYLKKILAAGLAAGMLLSMAACSDTSWVFNYDGEVIPAGLYIEMTMEAYNAAAEHKDYNEDETDLFKQKLDGKDARQWMVDEARRMADSYIAVERKFKELELSISAEDQAVIDQSIESTWAQYSETYEKNGVGKANYTLAVTNAWKKQQIFNKYYGKGGLEEVKTKDIETYYNENFVNVNIFSVTLATGNELTDEQKADNEARKKSVDEYIKTINDGSKTFNEVQDSFNHTYLASLYGETHDETQPYDVIAEENDTKRAIKKDSEQFSAEIMDAMFNLKVGGDAKALEQDGTYYIVKRYDNKDSFEGMKETILSDMKSGDLDKQLDEIVAVLNPSVNGAAVSRYNPQNVDLSTPEE